MSDLRVFLACLSVATICCGGRGAVSGSGSGSGSSSTAGPRMDLHCTPQTDFDEVACARRGQGCGYGPPLICRGIDVDDATKDEERRAYESGKQPCTCICEQDRIDCSQVP